MMKCPKCKKEKPQSAFQAKHCSKICKQCDVCRSKADARMTRYKGKNPKAYKKKQQDWLKTPKGLKHKEKFAKLYSSS